MCTGGGNAEGENAEHTKGGEPKKFDPNFKGPVDKRSCTDIICCLLFIICFTGMICVGLWAYTQGDPTLLLYPTDSDGNLCGIGTFKDKPYLFFFDLIDCARVGVAVAWMGCPTPQICVGQCPNKKWTAAPIIAKEKNPVLKYNCSRSDRDNLICQNNVNPYNCQKICVKTCPAKYWEWFSQYALETADSSQISGRSNMYCKYSISNPETSSQSVLQLVEDEDCAAYYLNSSALAGRCIPTFITLIVDAAGDLVNSNESLVDKFGNAVNGTVLEDGTKYLAILLSAKEYGMRIYQDVRATWWMILIFLGIAMVVCFIWIFLMRWIAGIMVWVTIIAFGIVFAFATYYCFNKYFKLKDLPTSNGAFQFTTNLSYYTNLSETWLALGCIAAFFLLIVLILLIFLRSRIMIAIALIKEASRAVGNMVFTLFWPIFPWLLQVILFAFWGASAIFLASTGASRYASSFTNTTNTSDGSGGFVLKDVVQEATAYVPCDPTENSTAGSVCDFLLYGGDEYTKYLQFFMLFMLFWVMNFIIALGQMTLAGAFASYYWAFQKPADIPAFPVSASLWRCFRYHLGTLAFGSLLVAIVQMIRVILEYLDRKLKGKENAPAKFLLKCLKCCFWCLEKFIKFINKNAYILTAIYGYNFCGAAMQAFSLILRNVLRVAVVDRVTDFIVFIGKLVVTGAVSILAMLFLGGELHDWIPIHSVSDYVKSYQPSLNYILLPVIIIGVGSFVIASGFFAVYSMGVDTLFLCFLEDLERHDGSQEKPYYMSKELMKILGKKNDPAVAKAKKE